MQRVRANVLGVATDVITYDASVSAIEGFIAEGGPHYVCVNSTQDIVLARADEGFRRLVNGADLAIPDGWPVVWALRTQGFEQRDRVTGPDLMLRLCERSARTGHSHLFYGGAEGVPGLLAETLGKKFPGLRVAGAYSPPFRPLSPEEDERIVDLLNGSGADVLWVGLGTPKQHFWIREHMGKVRIPVMIGVGAAFDFHSGRIPRAPAWMQRNGLEWLHRLCQEPRRLWWRYLNCLPRFAAHAALQRLSMRDYPLD